MTCDALQTWGLLPLLLPSASVLAGDNLLCRLQSTSGCRTDGSTREMPQMQSRRPGIRCWWAVRMSCRGLGGEGRWCGQQDMGRGYTGEKDSREQVCDIVQEWKSLKRKEWRAKVQLGCQAAWRCWMEGRQTTKNFNQFLLAGPWPLHKVIFFQSAVCLNQR